MKLSGLFDRRVRGFRIVEIGGMGVLLVLVLAVYLSKTGAGGERADIDHVSQQISDEQTRIRLLQAEVANLEQPERLETLSNQYLGLQPISAKHEVEADSLPDIALVQRVAKVADSPSGAAPASDPTKAATPSVADDPDADPTPATKTAAKSDRDAR